MPLSARSGGKAAVPLEIQAALEAMIVSNFDYEMASIVASSDNSNPKGGAPSKTPEQAGNKAFRRGQDAWHCRCEFHTVSDRGMRMIYIGEKA